MKEDKVFIDTNVLLYLYGDDPDKARVSEDVLRAGGIISVQVLNEMAAVIGRKRKLEWLVVREMIRAVTPPLKILPLTAATHKIGLEIADRYCIAFYDSLLIAAALIGGCNRFISEDLQHGLVIGQSLVVVNPYSEYFGHLH